MLANESSIRHATITSYFKTCMVLIFSHFATHLTTINLATRDLIDDENYPQIARSDFFDVESGKTFLSLPSRVAARGLGKTQHRDIQIPLLDAAIANPPYVRQEDIPSVKKKKGAKTPTHGTKEYYQWLTEKEFRLKLGWKERYPLLLLATRHKLFEGRRFSLLYHVQPMA